jgi:hypothetical protein
VDEIPLISLRRLSHSSTEGGYRSPVGEFLPDMHAHDESHIDSAHTHMETRWYLSYEYDRVCPDLLRPGMGRVFSICSGDKK